MVWPLQQPTPVEVDALQLGECIAREGELALGRYEQFAVLPQQESTVGCELGVSTAAPDEDIFITAEQDVEDVRVTAAGHLDELAEVVDGPFELRSIDDLPVILSEEFKEAFILEVLWAVSLLKTFEAEQVFRRRNAHALDVDV